MYAEESKKVARTPRKNAGRKGSDVEEQAGASNTGAEPGTGHGIDSHEHPHGEPLRRGTSAIRALTAKEGVDEPQLHLLGAVFTLAASTAVVAVCAEFMVDSIGAITSGANSISAEFVGLILLPIVGNAAEHATAVTVACKDKMDLAIGVTVGSSMQIALLVIPFSVILGWILGNDTMNLSFDGFQVAVLFVSVLLVNYLISDGKSHWLEGVLLQCLYLIIAITAW
jgi:Ca2+:H+ antiporter